MEKGVRVTGMVCIKIKRKTCKYRQTMPRQYIDVNFSSFAMLIEKHKTLDGAHPNSNTIPRVFNTD